MLLKLLLDENLSHVVATQIKRHRPDLPVESIHEWREGSLLSHRDGELLVAAHEDRYTLVTYDQNTIPPLFFAFVQQGRDHSGVVFIDQNTLTSDDFGGLVRALTTFWDEQRDRDFRNVVMYLKRA